MLWIWISVLILLFGVLLTGILQGARDERERRAAIYAACKDAPRYLDCKARWYDAR